MDKLKQIVDIILNEQKDKQNIKIGLYSGCFDPIHYGHIEAADKALSYCDYVIITAIYKNKSKPLLSDHKHRSIMIQNMLEEYHNTKKVKNKIFFVDDNLDRRSNPKGTIISQLRNNKKFYLVGIGGSDFYFRFSKQNKISINVDKWIIIPRNDFPINTNTIGKMISNVKTILMDENIFQKQHLSSSYVRKIIKQYHTLDKENNKNLDWSMCEKNKEYIIKNELFQ